MCVRTCVCMCSCMHACWHGCVNMCVLSLIMPVCCFKMQHVAMSNYMLLARCTMNCISLCVYCQTGSMQYTAFCEFQNVNSKMRVVQHRNERTSLLEGSGTKRSAFAKRTGKKATKQTRLHNRANTANIRMCVLRYIGIPSAFTPVCLCEHKPRCYIHGFVCVCLTVRRLSCMPVACFLSVFSRRRLCFFPCTSIADHSYIHGVRVHTRAWIQGYMYVGSRNFYIYICVCSYESTECCCAQAIHVLK